MVADYIFYEKFFRGNLLTADNFNRYANKAIQYIESVSQRKLINELENPLKVMSIQNCVCALAEEYYKIEEYRKNRDRLKEEIVYEKLNFDSNNSGRNKCKGAEYETIQFIINQHLAQLGFLHNATIKRDKI